MTPAPKFIPDPKIWKAAQVAARLGVKANSFYSRRAGLEAMGFPAKDDLLGGWHAAAVDAWLDNRARVGKYRSVEIVEKDEIAEAIANVGKNAA